jgi:hypothetical protein
MASRILLKRHRKFLVNTLFVSERKTIKNELPDFTRRGNRRHFSSSSSSSGTSTVAEHPFTAKRIGLFIVSSTAAVIFIAEGQAENWWRGAEDEGTDMDINLPRVYNRSAIQDYWKQRPMSIARRLGHIIYEIGPVGVRYLGYKHSPFSSNNQVDIQLHEQVVGALSRDLKEALTNQRYEIILPILETVSGCYYCFCILTNLIVTGQSVNSWQFVPISFIRLS